MLKSSKLINTYIANAQPNDYDSVSYGKYFRDLANISNAILEDNESMQNGFVKILLNLNKLPDCEIKNNIINIIQEIIK